MMIGWYLVGILALGFLMVVHEGGHYFAARANGMRVTKFSIGFGPAFFRIVPNEGYYWFTTAADRIKIRLFRHNPEKHGPTIFQVAMIPFFAYVQIAGMNPMEEVDPNDKGSYANASLFGRIFAIFGGPAANYLFASVFFFASFFFGGRLVATTNTDVNVVPGRPAQVEGRLQDGDRIVEVAGVPVQKWDQMAAVISQNPGKRIPIVVDRKGERISTMVTPDNDSGKGRIGVEARAERIPVTAKEAAVLAVTMPPDVVRDLVVGLGQVFTGKAKGELSGPVGIVKETARAAKNGWTHLLFLLGALSAYLGAFNLIPFPALDGGRLMFLAYEATTRRRPNAHIEAAIHAFGFVTLLVLVFYVTFANDLRAK